MRRKPVFAAHRSRIKGYALMKLSRKDRSLISEWWFTVDRLMLSAIIIIICAGLLISLAASPPIALKNDLEAFYFVKRHMLFFLPTLIIMIAISLLTPKQMRHLSLIVFLFGLFFNGFDPHIRH